MSIERTSKLNASEIEEARCYLRFLAKGSVPYCGLNSDDSKGCGKNITKLQDEWNIKQKFKKKESKRIKPFLVINEKKGYGLHRYKNGNLEYCGNTNYFCFSCNAIEKREGSNVIVDANAGYSNTKSRKVRPLFKEKLLEHLAKLGDICEEGCVNKWSDTGMFDCAQKLLRESIGQLIDHRVLRVNKLDYGFECEYSMCSGMHLVHAEKHYQPIPKMTDQEAIEQELKPNEK